MIDKENSNKECAIKILNQKAIDEEGILRLKQESNILKSLRH